MSDPNCRFLDSKCILAAAEKLPFRSIGEDPGESKRSSTGDCGADEKLVMQSTTSTWFAAACPLGGVRRSDSSASRRRKRSEM